MYCKNCGSELPDGASFCTSCGASQAGISNETAIENPSGGQEIRPPEIYANPISELPQQVKKPKKKGLAFKIIAFVLVALILISGVTVLGYFTFMPAKMTLKAAQYFSVLKNFNAFDKNMTRYENKVVKPVYEGTVDTKGEVSLSLDKELLAATGMPTESIDLFSQYLQDLSFSYGMASDMKGKKENLSLGLNYQKNPLVTLNMFLNKDEFGLSSPELTSKTIAGSFQDIGKLNEVFPDIPQEVLDVYTKMDPWMGNNVYDKIKIDRQDIKKLMFDYTAQIIDSIDDSDMTIERGQTTDVLGKDVGVQEITIKLDQKAQKKILTDLISRMKDDQNLYNLTCGNIIKLFDIMGENEVFNTLLQGVDMKQALSQSNYRKALTALKGSIDETMLPESITANIYIQGVDIVKISVKAPAGNAGAELKFVAENVTKDQSYERKYTLSASTAEETAINFTLNLKKDYNASLDTTNFKAEATINSNMSNNEGTVSFVLDSKEKADSKTKVKHTVNVSFDADIINNGAPTKGNITLKLDGKLARNSKGLDTSSDYTGDVTVNIPDQLPQPITIGFNVTSETAYDKKITTPDTSKGDVLNIATATQEDYDNLMNEIYQKLGSLSMMLGGGQ